MFLSGDREQANDLAQATCLRALENHRHFRAGTHLDRWLFVMARRIWLNEMRKASVVASKNFVSIEEIEVADKKPSPEVNIMASDVLSRLMALPEAQRETAALVYVEGHTYREASEMLDVPIGTVMSRLSIVRKKLAEEHDASSKENV